MLIPPPLPAYTLAPGLPEPSAVERRAIERCVASLGDEAAVCLVTGVRRTGRHMVIELLTPSGPLLVLERQRPSRVRTDALTG